MDDQKPVHMFGRFNLGYNDSRPQTEPENLGISLFLLWNLTKEE